jgi:hypothetical protein
MDKIVITIDSWFSLVALATVGGFSWTIGWKLAGSFVKWLAKQWRQIKIGWELSKYDRRE